MDEKWKNRLLGILNYYDFLFEEVPVPVSYEFSLRCRISIISAGVTTIGVLGKCFVLPVTRYASSLERATQRHLDREIPHRYEPVLTRFPFCKYSSDTY